MKLRTVSMLSLLVLLTACLSSPQQVETTHTFKKMEALQKIKINNEQMSFKVLSTGCTKPEDFIFSTKINDRLCQLTIYRIKPDLCKRAALPKKITLHWDKNTHCEDKDIQLMNPSMNQKNTTF